MEAILITVTIAALCWAAWAEVCRRDAVRAAIDMRASADAAQHRIRQLERDVARLHDPRDPRTGRFVKKGAK